MKDHLVDLGVGVLIGFLLSFGVRGAVDRTRQTPDDDKASLAGLQAQATAMSNIIWQSDKVKFFVVSDWIEINRRAAELAKKIELQEKP